MNRQHFTMNPALPHPDSESDTTPTLEEAVAVAYAMLTSTKEGPGIQYARRRAAFDLMDAYTTHKEETQ